MIWQQNGERQNPSSGIFPCNKFVRSFVVRSPTNLEKFVRLLSCSAELAATSPVQFSLHCVCKPRKLTQEVSLKRTVSQAVTHIRLALAVRDLVRLRKSTQRVGPLEFYVAADHLSKVKHATAFL